MMALKFSIIVPSFNQGQYIQQTISSILNQDGNQTEIIVIDGGSSDNTVSILESFGTSIAYWVSEPDNGQSHAINKGLAKATGDIVAWLNSDDLYNEDAFAAVAKVFDQNPDIDLAHGACHVFGSNIKSYEIKMKPGFEIAQHLAGMPSAQPSYFFRKELLTRVGNVNESLHHGMDYDLFLRMSLDSSPYYIPEVLSKYRIHNASKSTNDNAKFAKEWASIFSSLLKDMMASEEIELWQALGLYDPISVEYDTSRVTLTELHRASGLSLYNIATFLNAAGNLQKTAAILNTIKKSYPEIYRFCNISKDHWKLKIRQVIPF